MLDLLSQIRLSCKLSVWSTMQFWSIFICCSLYVVLNKVFFKCRKGQDFVLMFLICNNRICCLFLDDGILSLSIFLCLILLLYLGFHPLFIPPRSDFLCKLSCVKFSVHCLWCGVVGLEFCSLNLRIWFKYYDLDFPRKN